MNNESWNGLARVVDIVGVIVAFCWLVSAIGSCSADKRAKASECAAQCAGNTDCIAACQKLGYDG